MGNAVGVINPMLNVIAILKVFKILLVNVTWFRFCWALNEFMKSVSPLKIYFFNTDAIMGSRIDRNIVKYFMYFFLGNVKASSVNNIGR